MACTVGGQIIPQLNVEEATEDGSPSRSISTRRSKTSFSPFSSRKHHRAAQTHRNVSLMSLCESDSAEGLERPTPAGSFSIPR
ncbi:hypothetical protein DPX16_10585 [Anabarilius grahami]|uniref:Uncharacterized protein n=1 Tax=Anabarilius grahami TaxID=495550 RepID=A0A3N0Z794_ANAGA|nr:hypothetical protein DPX16_10585 [Anabarilius grahami]